MIDAPEKTEGTLHDRPDLGAIAKDELLDIITKIMTHEGYQLEDKLAKILSHRLLPDLMKRTLANSLLSQGVDVNTRNHVLLRWAAEHGYLDIVTACVQKGSDLHVMKDEPLIRASVNNHLEVVDFLLESGADLHAKDDCALRLAAGQSLTMVKQLLEKGADPLAKQNSPCRQSFKAGQYAITYHLLHHCGEPILELAMNTQDKEIFHIARTIANDFEDEALSDLVALYQARLNQSNPLVFKRVTEPEQPHASTSKSFSLG